MTTLKSSLVKLLGKTIIEIILAIGLTIGFVYFTIWVLSDAYGTDLYLYLPEPFFGTVMMIVGGGYFMFAVYRLVCLYLDNSLDYPEEIIVEELTKKEK